MKIIIVPLFLEQYLEKIKSKYEPMGYAVFLQEELPINKED